ncbi:MAG: hypothetical protein F6K21_08320 [Symploca sp. SIO2D2]|nr:hypothetical protein [Symploca sp. SIO2D2]
MPRRLAFLIPLSLFLIGATVISPTEGLARKIDYSQDDTGTANRKNDLSQQRVISIREQLIGRELVSRLNWRAQHVIHDSLAMHASQTLASGKDRNSGQSLDFGLLQTPAGEVSFIIGLNLQHPNDIFLFARTSRGTKYTITVRAPLRSKKRYENLADDWLTASWLEEQIANQAFRFLPKVDISRRPNALTLKRPAAKGLTLNMPAREIENPVTEDAAQPPSAFPAYLSNLRIEASPQRVRRGERVSLILDYEIEGNTSSTLAATETRQLSKDGEPLPGYPIIREFQRDTGSLNSVYKQRIPPTAKTGEYVFEGKVCVNGECISRIVRFVVE